MAAQVTQWLYDNMAWAHWAGATWSYEETQATLAKLFEHFSCTPRLDNADLIYDHILDDNYGLTIRPVTQYLDDNQGVATGVLDFKIEETQDLKFKASDVGIYGQFPVDDLIKMVWQACGLQVQESWQNTYLIRCRQHLTPGKSICNAHIINAAGTVCVYVNKGLIDLIIEAMDLEGMFYYEEAIPEKLEAGTTTIDYSSHLSVINPACNALQGTAWREYVQTHPDYSAHSMNGSQTYSAALAALTAAGYDVDDFPGLYAQSTWYSGSAQRKSCSLYFYKYDNDEITTAVDIEREDLSETFSDPNWMGSAISYASNNVSITATCVEVYVRCTISDNVLTYDTPYGARTFSPQTVANFYKIIAGHRSMKSSGTYYEDGLYNNVKMETVRPEGITAIEGAITGEEGTASSDFWSSWVERAITLQTVSIDTFDFDTTTFIPIGYHDPTAEVTQLDMQLGKIKGREYLQRLGVRLTDMDDFKPITWDPDDPDDPDNQPIKPDPDPTPSPTPVDPSDPSDTSARLFQVHQLSDTEVNALGNFIYSSDFISAITNMFTEPMDAIIGCFRLHYRGTLPIGANERIKLGSILGTSATTGNKIVQQFYTVTFGSVAIPEHYANVEDYDYTEAEIFLPYIGFCPLSIKDIMAGTVELAYTFDLYTGACIARIYITKNGTKQELYNFNGNSAVMVPLTGRDFTVGVSHLVSGAVGIIAGVATGGASGAISATIGASNLVGKESSIRHSGSCGSNLGAMSNQTPYIVIRRPKAYNASSWPSYYGQPSWWTSSIGSLSGYTRVRYVKLDGLHCTDDERKEIEQLLMAGVYV